MATNSHVKGSFNCIFFVDFNHNLNKKWSWVIKKADDEEEDNEKLSHV